MLDLISDIFKGYGKFILLVGLAIIAPEISHQHLNYSSFGLDTRLLFRYGILFIALAVLIRDVIGGELNL